MLLAIDIGNTNINLALFRANKLIKGFYIPTKLYSSRRLYSYLRKSKVEDVIICSVVPEITRVLSRDLKKKNHRQPYILGKNIEVAVKNLYRQPQQVGQDRLVNAYAGIRLYGAPLVVVDFGTAITFDIISKKKEYLGGMILPGLKISLEMLAEKTALLPKINLARPGEFIGRDTKNSMLSGIVYGYVSLVDELVKKIKNKIGKNALVIGTGGNIDFIAGYCKNFDKIDRNLTLKGLNLIYHEFKK